MDIIEQDECKMFGSSIKMIEDQFLYFNADTSGNRLSMVISIASDIQEILVMFADDLNAERLEDLRQRLNQLKYFSYSIKK